jgi:DnaJ-class molecular chaperone
VTSPKPKIWQWNGRWYRYPCVPPSASGYATWEHCLRDVLAWLKAAYIKCGLCGGLGYRRNFWDRQAQPRQCPSCKGVGYLKTSAGEPTEAGGRGYSTCP